MLGTEDSEKLDVELDFEISFKLSSFIFLTNSSAIVLAIVELDSLRWFWRLLKDEASADMNVELN